MIKKLCFYEEPNNICIGKGCIRGVDWETCDAGKLSDEYKMHEKAKTEKAKRIRDEVLQYMGLALNLKEFNKAFHKGRLTKMIKRNL
jgi:hypothetical protein